jgi:hypothetical protein
MNSNTGHIVSPNFLALLKEADVAGDYELVPPALEAEAIKLLDGKDEAYLPGTGTPLDREAQRLA